MALKQPVTQEEIYSFLEGRDPQERIVNLDYSYKNDYITVIYRNENDEKCKHQAPFHPFLWATRNACNKLIGENREREANLRFLLRKYGIKCEALDIENVEGVPCEKMKDGYTFLFRAKSAMSYSRFLNFFKEAGYPVFSDKKDGDTTTRESNKNDYLTVTPQEQFLISTGKRFFKGYDDYNDILRMIFDLETEGLDPSKHRIEWYGIRFNRPITFNGTSREFETEMQIKGVTKEEKDASELKLIDTALRIIYTFRPDVITAHNGEQFDWNFIIERCKQLGTSIEEMSSKYFNGRSICKNQRESVLKLGGEVEHFYQTIVPGITVTDSLHAVRRAQATDSNFKKGDLKYATKYLKMVKPNRVYIPGDKISQLTNDYEEHYAFNNKNGKWYLIDEKHPLLADGNYKAVSGHYIVERYLGDDLWECDKVEYALNSTDFMLCKIVPVPFSKCVTMGTAGQWKAIMLAWSYERGLAIPKPENTGAFTGGLSRLLRVGYVDKVIKLDYNSLYPSIILTWAISDDTDLMGAMLDMLEYVLTTRETHKGLKKKAGKIVDKYEEEMNKGVELTAAEIEEYNKASNDYKIEDNRQASVKKLGNSFFGSYGSNNGSVFPWKSVKCAERTTCTGRMALRLMISHFHKLGYEPIVGDTDGFNFKLPDSSKYRYTEENPYIGKGLSRETKEGKEYSGYEADVAEFNDMYMRDFHYAPRAVNKMGLGIDEVVSATINFSRKNYADYFPEKPYPEDVKLVGNTVKSKKMPEYISNFLDKGIRLLLQNKGHEFLEEYYNYIEKIYNYQIPLKDIASKGKVKKSVNDYITDCKTITKAGRPKSRQAWMELAIRDGVKADMGETLYYINVGKTKSQADVKKVTHYYETVDGEKKDVVTKIEKEYKAYKKESKESGKKDVLTKDEFIKKNYPNVRAEEEIILNAILLPREMVESDEEFFCKEGQEYNVPKYIAQFNSRITPLLVCFSREIRDSILISNPSERKYFTMEEAELSSGEPNNPGDQDTYEQLMTMEDKEIKFWSKYPEFKIPYLEECGMNWEEIKGDYDKRQEEEKQRGIDIVRKIYDETLSNLTKTEKEELLEEGVLPSKLESVIFLDPVTGEFMCKQYPDYKIGSCLDILELNEGFSSDDD